MFSAQQLNNFKNACSRRVISQQTFDEAVKENIQDFDMEVRVSVQKTDRPTSRG